MSGAAIDEALPAGGKRQTSNVERQTLKERSAVGPARTAEYDLGERLLEFSARIIRLVDSMPSRRSSTHVGGQLLRSGTSPQSNHGEAQAAESVDDFIHKLKICKKELIESWRWLRLIARVPLVKKPDRIAPLIDETEQLVRIFSKSLQTAEARRDNRVQELPTEPDIDPWLIHFDLAFSVQRLTFDVQPPAGPSPFRPTRYPAKRRKPRTP